jgi:hypothetical protein
VIGQSNQQVRDQLQTRDASSSKISDSHHRQPLPVYLLSAQPDPTAQYPCRHSTLPDNNNLSVHPPRTVTVDSWPDVHIPTPLPHHAGSIRLCGSSRGSSASPPQRTSMHAGSTATRSPPARTADHSPANHRMPATQSISQARSEWSSKRRRMGCTSAVAWFCHRVPGFTELRLTRTQGAITWQHSVATDGTTIVDLVPHLDAPCCWDDICTCSQ